MATRRVSACATVDSGWTSPSAATSCSTSRRRPTPSCSSSRTSTRRRAVVAPRFDGRARGRHVVSYLDRFANRCRRMTFPAGEVHLRYDATVKDDGRVDVIDEQAPELAPADLPDEALQYLLPSRYCQSDELAAVRLRAVRRASRRAGPRVQADLQLGPRAHRLRLRRGVADDHRRRRAARRPRRVPRLHPPRRSPCAGRSTSRRATCSATCPTSTSPTRARRWTSAPGWRSGSATAGTRSIRATTSTASGAP